MSKDKQAKPVVADDEVAAIQAAAAAAGIAIMIAPKGSTGCSFGGESYEADEDGYVQVPVEAVGSLMDHGFTLP